MCRDGRGYLLFEEFLEATSESVSFLTLHHERKMNVDKISMQEIGSPEIKLKWQFKLYDKDKSGIECMYILPFVQVCFN